MRVEGVEEVEGVERSGFEEAEVAGADEAGGEGAKLIELDEDATKAFPTKKRAGDAFEWATNDLYLPTIEVRRHGFLFDKDMVILGLKNGAKILKLFVGYDQIFIAPDLIGVEVVVIWGETLDGRIGILGMYEFEKFGTGGAEEYKSVMERTVCNYLDGLTVLDLQ